MALSIFAAHEDAAGSRAGASDARELGQQPLDKLMTRLGLDNHDLVASSAEPLTHKMVQKGRKGRRLTPKIQCRILGSLNRLLAEREELSTASGDSPRFALKDLFTY